MVRSVMVVCAAGVALATGSASADRLPEPPCGASAWPAPAALDTPPAVAVAMRGGRDLRWPPPPCAGWQGDDFRMLVALAGRFRIQGGVEALLERLGAVSRLPEIRFWSVSGRAWKPLVIEAHALDGARGARRQDFSPDELRGAARFFSETGSFTSGAVTYRMTVREATAARLVVVVENVGVVRRLLVDLFDPGELQSLYVLEREGPDVWTYYSLTRTRDTASALTEGHQASYVNRAMALFRHYAGYGADVSVAWWR
jgi:hypothetical protein